MEMKRKASGSASIKYSLLFYQEKSQSGISISFESAFGIGTV